MNWPCSRDAALARWDEFLPKAPAYSRDRNQVVPGNENVSRMSPAIRYRLVIEDELIDRLVGRFGFSKVEKLIQEIEWRTYWKGWLELHPDVWKTYRHSSFPEEDEQRARQIEEGKTDVAIINQFAQELTRTGYLHNHVRMWFASYWIHVAGLPWELGARFFLRHLLDGDPASNHLSWRWVAGLQTPGKAYLVSRHNIEKCAPAILEHSTGLEHLEQVSPRIPTESKRPSEEKSLPIFPSFYDQSSNQSGLWIHFEDNYPESILGTDCIVRAVAVSLPGTIAEDAQWSNQRIQYIRRVSQDTSSRLGQHFQLAVDSLPGVNLHDELLKWAQTHFLDTVVTIQPFVGELADLFPRVKTVLEQAGIELIALRRERDQVRLPLARGGFFKYWEKVARLYR